MTANKQIGWSQEAILLHRISKELERLAGIIAASGGGGGTIPGLNQVLEQNNTAIDQSIFLADSSGNQSELSTNTFTLTGSTGITTSYTLDSISWSNSGNTMTNILLLDRTSVGTAQYRFDDTKPAGVYTLATTSSLPVARTLVSPASSIILNRVTVPGWTFPVTAGKTYRIEIIAAYQTGVATTGGSIGVILSSGTGTIRGYLDGDVSTSTAVATGLRITIHTINATNTTPNSFLTTTGSASLNTPTYIGGKLVFTCITSGQFEVQWATEVDTSAAQLNAGSVMYVTEY